MKHLFLLHSLLVILMTHSRLNSQNYYPFPMDSAEWHYEMVYPVLGPNDRFEYRRQFVQGEMQEYKGKMYSVVYRQDLCTCTCPIPSGYEPAKDQSIYVKGGIRYENGKVYFTTFGTGPFNSYFRPETDTLLFDFTLQLADTIPYAGTQFVVTKVDTLADGRKSILLQNLNGTPYSVYWVEGQGAWGLFQTTDWYYRVGSCFKRTPNECPIPCAVTTDTHSPEAQAAGIQLFPSFAQSLVSIVLDDHFEVTDLEIYSLTGQLIKTWYSPDTQVEIPVDDLPAGPSVWKFRAKDGQKVSKMYLK